MVQAHIFVSGRVQGVFYRQSTREMAEKINVAGWVRNLSDGRVEAVFEGGKKDVEFMVAWCRKGPRLSRVEEVAVEYLSDEGIRGFRIIG